MVAPHKRQLWRQTRNEESTFFGAKLGTRSQLSLAPNSERGVNFLWRQTQNEESSLAPNSERAQCQTENTQAACIDKRRRTSRRMVKATRAFPRHFFARFKEEELEVAPPLFPLIAGDPCGGGSDPRYRESGSTKRRIYLIIRVRDNRVSSFHAVESLPLFETTGS